MMRDYMVEVCDACLTASCWHGEFMCEKARVAGTSMKRASELRALAREHESNFSRAKLFAVTGRMP